jgi:hypothetical protein
MFCNYNIAGNYTPANNHSNLQIYIVLEYANYISALNRNSCYKYYHHNMCRRNYHNCCIRYNNPKNNRHTNKANNQNLTPNMDKIPDYNNEDNNTDCTGHSRIGYNDSTCYCLQTCYNCGNYCKADDSDNHSDYRICCTDLNNVCSCCRKCLSYGLNTDEDILYNLR